jgi:hypothetical protein
MPFKDELIAEIALAIGRMEGYYLDLAQYSEETLKRRGIKYIKTADGKCVTVAKGYNNPGNILGKWGNNPKSKDGFIIFPTPEAGWTALRHQVSKCLEFYSCSFKEFFGGQRNEKGEVRPGGYYGYAPAGHGNNKPAVYAQFVVNAVNKKFDLMVDIDTRMKDVKRDEPTST